MINKEKLRKFLMECNVEENENVVADDSYPSHRAYHLGQAHITAVIITKLDAGEFDEEVNE